VLDYGLDNANMDVENWNNYILERQIVFSVLTIFVWDFMLSFTAEVMILQMRRLNIPLLTHYISRLTTLTFVLCGLAIGTLPVTDCSSLRVTLGIFFVLAETSTSLLFFHRVRAVFFGERPILIAFAFLLLLLFGTSVVVPITTIVPYIPYTMYCDLDFSSHPASLITMVTAFVYDMLVSICISWRLVSRMNFVSQINGSKIHLSWTTLWSCLRGDNLPALSKALFRGGRKYFLHTLALDILVLCLVSNSFPLSYSNFMFALLFIKVSLKNIFACRLFRNTLLELTVDADEYGAMVKVKTLSQEVVFAEPDVVSSDSVSASGGSSSSTPEDDSSSVV